ncbi:general stress protein 26 [Rhizomicrobium palustre]|uniref:General stress protein 26 n=1 Tax=Rhizomicrobium palustre TaxID=189966 RepID=A0A846N4B9_9PROT|nr:pyridoxamine 5'-phosphate oxidase family protein [Rhizomicrobium palustre]NIK90315.1 general stress protein 26 [Rhizomicrobium palustre]
MPSKSQILKVMNAAHAVYLATMSENGPRVRALVNLRRRWAYPIPSLMARTDDFTVYLTTSKASDKIAEITADPRVSVYYSRPLLYRGVLLSGRAEVLESAALKQALWSNDWRIYWPDGYSNPDYVVVRLKPSEIRGWWGSKPFTFEGP